MMPNRLLFACYAIAVFLSLSSIEIAAQPFTFLESSRYDLVNGIVEWGDYDGDGDFDFVSPSTTAFENFLYRNEGSFSFTQLQMPEAVANDARWRDNDGDGDLDVLLGSTMYRNDGVEQFTLVGESEFVRQHVVWGDLDADGDQDATVYIRTFLQRETELFDDRWPYWRGIDVGDRVALVDADVNGLLDVFQFNGLSDVPASLLMQREDRVYEEGATFPTTAFVENFVIWRDFDNDGDPDLVQPGFDGNPVTGYYRNDLNGFTSLPLDLPDYNNMKAGDLDVDGDIDILVVTSEPSESKLTLHVYENNGTGAFTATEYPLSLDFSNLGSIELIDIDNDGDLDIATRLILFENNSFFSALFYIRNDVAGTNVPPLPPSNLQASVTFDAVQMSWDPGSDTEMPAAGLSYAVRVGTQPGLADVLAPQSHPQTGTSLIVRGRHVWTGLTRQLRRLPAGTYYWSVQSIDGLNETSVFAAEASFTIEGPEIEPLFNVQTLDVETNLADIKWFDYDDDGDLDAIGREFSNEVSIYKNEPGGFVNIDVTMYAKGFDVVDHDNDGDLDVFAGQFMYINRGNDVFERYEYTEDYTRVDCLAAGDFDNDGDADLFLQMDDLFNGNNQLFIVLRNDGNEVFVDLELDFTGLDVPSSSSQWNCTWVDIDRDGYQDLFFTAANPEGELVFKHFRNEGDGQFADQNTTVAHRWTTDWGDYDDDGDLDLATLGWNADQTTFIAKIYQNKGSAGLVEETTFEVPTLNEVDWGDVDGDGQLDLYVAGVGAPVFYRNDQGAFSTFDIGVDVGDISGISDSDWGDVDGDGDIDLIIASSDQYQDSPIQVFENMIGGNTPPLPPSGLSHTIDQDRVTFSWSASTDGESPASALTYQVSLGTAAGLDDVLSAGMSNAIRQNPQPGNAGPNTSWTINELPNGTYYWSVRAIDGSLVPSASAPEQSFVVSDSPVHKFYAIEVDLGEDLDDIFTAWGDYDGDGDLDVMVTGSFADVKTVQLYENIGGGAFELSDVVIPTFEDASASWADHDGDGDLDLFVIGQGEEGFKGLHVLDNTGDGFSDSGTFFEFLSSGETEWADLDNDGDLDMLHYLYNNTFSSVGIPALARYDGGRFNRVNQTPLGSAGQGKPAWNDFNKDGYRDFLFGGRLAENTDGIFNLKEEFLEDTGDGHWVDIDNDGDADLDIGDQIYLNNDGEFTVSTHVFPSSGGSVWADWDNDGDSDVLQSLSLLQHVDGQFEPVVTGLRKDRTFTRDWVDADNDGDLDLVMVQERGLTVYQNRGGQPNQRPLPPDELAAEVEVGAVHLSWNAGSDTETPAPGLRYNVRIGTVPGGNEVLAGMARADGTSLLPLQSNVDQNMSWKIRLLPEGTYYWSVQSIDTGFGTSAFAAEQSFTITTSNALAFTETSINLPQSYARPTFQSRLLPGDFDRDEDVDLMAYILDGEGNELSYFTQEPALNMTLAHVADTTETHVVATLEEGDYNNDGYPDVLAMMRGADIRPWIYRNIQGERFERYQITPDSLITGAYTWIDMDLDGDLDIAALERDSVLEQGIHATWYRNDRNNVFSKQPLELPDLDGFSLSSIDFDTDGDFDLLVSGEADVYDLFRPAVLYENQGGTFTPVPVTELNATHYLDWGDYDQDGDPDLAIVTQQNQSQGTILYVSVFRNDGDSGFELAFEAPGFVDLQRAKSLEWVDINNDGRLDLSFIAFGYSYAYLQEDGHRFKATGFQTADTFSGTGVWMDIDGDADQDLLLETTGEDPNIKDLTLYLNESTLVNEKPSAPSGLVSTLALVPGFVMFGWERASDDKTLAEGLSYNLRVGTSPGGSEIMSPLTGSRMGNVGQNLQWQLTLAEGATYYWAVQSIDGSGAASAFFEGEPFIYVDTHTESGSLPHQFTVKGNYPNPFNGTTNIVLDMPAPAEITVTLYDVLGRKVRSVGPVSIPSGWSQTVPVSGGGLSAGVYFYTIESAGNSEIHGTGRMIVSH